MEPSGNSKASKAVLIGVPAYRLIEVSTARFVAELCCYSAHERPDIVVGVDFADEMPVAGCKHCYHEGSDFKDARNYFVNKALAKGFTHLCMIDADMDRCYKQPNGYKMLASLLDANRDVIAPLFMRRSEPYDLLARRYDPKTGLRSAISPAEAASGKIIDDIDEVGAGMMVIDCRVLREMQHPRFCFEVRNGDFMPEDVNFCRKVRQKGFSISVHTGWHLDHIGRHRYTPMEAIELHQYAADKRGQDVLDELCREEVPEVA
jgi:hypothetical protein